MEYIKLMRPKQYIKNLFVLGAILFSGDFFDINAIKASLLAFVSFCLISSFVYTINDIVDVEKDKVHPKKCKRPIASGKIKKNNAIVFSIFLAIASITIAFTVNKGLVFIIGLYMINNILYSFKIKNIVLVDVFSIAIGFVLRVYAGAVAIGVATSNWIILCTFFISLFMGFGKRLKEITSLKDNAASHRKILRDYDVDYLEKMITVTLAATLVCYAIYAATIPGNENMIITTVFVVYGALRYSYVMHVLDEGNPTDVVLADKHIIITVILWIVSCIVFILS